MVILLGARERHEDHDRGEELGGDRGDRNTGYPEMEDQNKNQIQTDIDQAGDHQEIKRPLGITDGAENTGAKIIHRAADKAGEIDTQVKRRTLENIFGRTDQSQHRRSQRESECAEYESGNDRESNGGMNGILQLRLVARAEILRDNDTGAGRQAREESNDQEDDGSGTANGRKGCRADKTANHQRIGGVVELLEQVGQHHGKRKGNKLLPDHAFRHVQVTGVSGHRGPPSQNCF